MRPNANDLIAFVAVARERSFTRAAANLGVSTSALSHTMRGLEERLGVRLLARTTRSVTPTEAGERLLNGIGPRFDEIDAEVAALNDLREKPAGHIRISADELAATRVLWPALHKVLPDYPDISIEIVTENGLVDIVAGGFDAGVRIGDIVAKDMIAVPLGPDMRMVAVAAPAYWAAHARPQTPRELTAHTCINIRLPTHGGLYAWEFERDGRELRVRVEGQLVLNSIMQVRQAALDGFGVAYIGEQAVEADIAEGRLIPVLLDWSPPFAGYHLYYPSRRQHTPAFTILIDALRYRAAK
ncbi:LysR family transcriptional regulator [Phenylobacterium sp. LjRoot225]|uniref:LysR family transcriptional regulator n=1 Tax=Phenylobacterium sp. LjRoot225 TaxID=3342285 RepID=UPI003ECD6C65